MLVESVYYVRVCVHFCILRLDRVDKVVALGSDLHPKVLKWNSIFIILYPSRANAVLRVTQKIGAQVF